MSDSYGEIQRVQDEKITQNISVGRGFVKEPQKKIRRGNGNEMMPAHRAWLIMAKR